MWIARWNRRQRWRLLQLEGCNLQVSWLFSVRTSRAHSARQNRTCSLVQHLIRMSVSYRSSRLRPRGSRVGQRAAVVKVYRLRHLRLAMSVHFVVRARKLDRISGRAVAREAAWHTLSRGLKYSATHTHTPLPLVAVPTEHRKPAHKISPVGNRFCNAHQALRIG